MTVVHQIAHEWSEVFPLLASVHGRFPLLTIGEVVHIAAVMGDGEPQWGSMPGAVTVGLQMVLDLPTDTEFGPQGPKENG